MLTIQTILCPTDFSEQSAAAFDLACSLARDYQARLVVVFVKPPREVVYGKFGMSPPELEGEVEYFNERLTAIEPTDKTITLEHVYREGDPANGIVRLAEEVNADLIVMGTHGRGGVPRMLLGSVAENVVRQAPCPVVTMKQPVAAEVYS